LELKAPTVGTKMMVEDLGVEAKEASVREVAKLLPLPELLQSIASIKADYITRQQVPIPLHIFSFYTSLIILTKLSFLAFIVENLSAYYNMMPISRFYSSEF
jgi:hypothetical protein